MRPCEERRRIRFWKPDSPSVAGMFRLEHEDCLKTTYSGHFVVVAVYQGAFDGWYRGRVRTHVAGALKLKEPGEVHRDVRVHAPFTLQGAWLSHELVVAAADALGLRGPVQFRAPTFEAGERATQLAFAMHAALVRPEVAEIERETRVAELLAEVLGDASRAGPARGGESALRAVRLARAFLHDALAEKVTLDELAAQAGLDKFHLVRAFRSEVGLPPYEYLTHLRVAKARELLQRGAPVAEVAQAVGLYDQSQLHRHFRRILGITPGSFSRSFAGPARERQHRPSRVRATGAHWSHERTPPQ
jgi:AraC-like DNA-binding protein